MTAFSTCMRRVRTHIDRSVDDNRSSLFALQGAIESLVVMLVAGAETRKLRNCQCLARCRFDAMYDSRTAGILGSALETAILLRLAGVAESVALEMGRSAMLLM